MLTTAINRRFSGDESFLRDPNAFNDAKNTATLEVIDEPISEVGEKAEDKSRLWLTKIPFSKWYACDLEDWRWENWCDGDRLGLDLHVAEHGLHNWATRQVYRRFHRPLSTFSWLDIKFSDWVTNSVPVFHSSP
jgi:hypothetical protein